MAYFLSPETSETRKPLIELAAAGTALGAQASASNRSLERVIADAFNNNAAAFDSRVATRLHAFSRIVRLTHVQPRGWRTGRPQGAPPAGTPEGIGLPSFSFSPSLPVAQARTSIGGVSDIPLESGASLTPETVQLAAYQLGDWVADAIELHCYADLFSRDWSADQLVAEALSLPALATACAKLAALSDYEDPIAPPAEVLAIAPDLIPVAAALWNGGRSPFAVVVSRGLPAGRWLLLPGRPTSSLTVGLFPDLSAKPQSKTVAGVEVTVRGLIAETLDTDTAKDGETPLHIIAGGADLGGE